MLSNVLDEISQQLGAVCTDVVEGGRNYIAKCFDGERYVAVKIPKNCVQNTILCSDDVLNLRRELEMLKFLGIDAMFEILEIVELKNFAVMVRDFFDYTLRDRVREQRLAIPEAVRMGLDIAEILMKLHRREYVYGDLKPDNIVFNGENWLLIDFETVTKEFTRPRLITMDFMPPEYFSSNIVVRTSDVYQLALVLIYSMTGKICNPVYGCNVDEEPIHDDVKKLVMKMLNPNPFARPSIENVIQMLSSILS